SYRLVAVHIVLAVLAAGAMDAPTMTAARKREIALSNPFVTFQAFGQPLMADYPERLPVGSWIMHEDVLDERVVPIEFLFGDAEMRQDIWPYARP
ncbi:hypothetical protein ACHAO3_009268, partial [Verticillium nonalfalfae]